MPHICNAPLGTILKNSILDPAVSKYFIAAQLSVQYLIFCIQYLEKNILNLKDANKNNEEEILKLKKCIRKRESESFQLLKRLHSKDQLLNTCTKCAKSFDGLDNLNSHMIRKHQTSCSIKNVLSVVNPVSDENLINAIKLELDINKLKERLNVTEKFIKSSESVNPEHEEIKSIDCSVCQLHNKISMVNFSGQTNFEYVTDAPNNETCKKFIEQILESDKYEKVVEDVKSQLNNLMADFKVEFCQKNSKNREMIEEEMMSKHFVQLQKQFKTFEQLFAEHNEQLNENIKSFEEKVFQNIKDHEIFFRNTPIKTAEKPVALPRKINQHLDIPTPIKRVLPKPVKRTTFNLIPEIANEYLINETLIQENPNKTNFYSYNRDFTVKKLLTKPISKPTLIKTKFNFDKIGKSDSIAVEKPGIKPKTNIFTNRNDVTKLLDMRMAELGIDSKENKLSRKILERTLEHLHSKRTINSTKIELYNILKTKIDNIVECLKSKKDKPTLNFKIFLEEFKIQRAGSRHVSPVQTNYMHADTYSNIHDDDNESDNLKNNPQFFKNRIIFDGNKIDDPYESQSISSSSFSSTK